MHRVGVLTVLAILAFISPWGPVHAQSQAASGGGLADDVAGDVMVQSPGGTQAAPQQHFQALDLTHLEVLETDEGFTFSLAVAALDKAPEAPGLDDGVYAITFQHLDQPYRILLYRALGDQAYYWGALLKYDPQGTANYQRFLNVVGDPASGTMTAVVMREDLQDRHGAAPFPGRTLSGFWVESHLRTHEDQFLTIAGIEPTKSYDVTDRMPDAGNATSVVTVHKGLAQLGHAALWSPEPVRASNGEQATFVFNVTGQNLGDKEDVFELSATNVPEGWTINMPASTVRIGAGEIVPLPVLVSTPFAHLHGAVKSFRVELRSQSDPNTLGRLDLAIRYFAVPQPAGHHNTLFLHGATFGSANPLFQVFELGFSGNSGFPYMNTLEKDTEDANKPIDAYYQGWGCFRSCAQPESHWILPVGLQPGLEMGLDFDLSGKLTIQAPIVSKDLLPQTTMEGYLVHERYDEAHSKWVSTVLASLPRTAPVDLQPNKVEQFTWEASPTAAADYLPYAKRAYLTLVLNVSSVRPSLFTGVEAPALAPGGVLRLPLFEYHDPVTDSLKTVGAVRLEPLGERDRGVNPGKAAVFSARLVNDLDQPVHFELNLSGIHSEWSQILGAPSVDLAPRSAAELHVAVRIPADAPNHEVADLVLEAQDPAHSAVRTLIRLRATVDTGATQPDDTAQLAQYEAPPSKASPMPALAAPLAGLAVALALRRRR